MTWDGTRWVPKDGPDEPGSSDRAWREWAGSLGPPHLADLAARAATDVLRTGASVAAGVAGAHIAAGIAAVTDPAQLQAELAWIQSVIDDLERQGAPKALVD